MIVCNYVQPGANSLNRRHHVPFRFFGKGIGALGWTVVSDTSPKEILGLSGGLFNTFGNAAAITTAIIIGYLIKMDREFFPAR